MQDYVLVLPSNNGHVYAISVSYSKLTLGHAQKIHFKQ